MALKETEATARDVALDLCAVLEGDTTLDAPFGSEDTYLDAIQPPLVGIDGETVYLTLSDGTAWSVKVERYEDAF